MCEYKAREPSEPMQVLVLCFEEGRLGTQNYGPDSLSFPEFPVERFMKLRGFFFGENYAILGENYLGFCNPKVETESE